MKISQKQANLLAIEIFKQLKQKKVSKVSDEMKKKLVAYIEKREALKKKDQAISEEIRKHEQTLFGIVGKLEERIYNSDTITQMLSKVEAKNMPSVSDIENEIILNAMFADDSDLQAFMDKIISKYEKKNSNKLIAA